MPSPHFVGGHLDLPNAHFFWLLVLVVFKKTFNGSLELKLGFSFLLFGLSSDSH
jgi:hypothetical protein